VKKYSACQYIVDYLIKNDMRYVPGVIGHGILALADALLERKDEIHFIQVKHEQSAAHFADGYYRVTGKPLACFTSVGPGAINALVGVGTAFHDSTPLALFTANCPTYMFQRGALQALEINSFAEFGNMISPITKRSYQLTNIKQLPTILETAFRLMTTGRPGPVHIELPMDMQAETVQEELLEPEKFNISSRMLGDVREIEKAADLILKSRRPVLLVGGGVILSGASAELVRLAECLGIPVVTTVQGKGAIPEDHELNAYYTGSFASLPGLNLTRKADLIIGVGCRFSERTTQSFISGKSFDFSKTKLIQIDIDPREIGKNYAVDVGVLGDAKTCLSYLMGRIKAKAKKKNYRQGAYFRELQDLKKKWRKMLEKSRTSNERPMTHSRFFAELRSVLDRDAIVLGPAGHAQAILFQEFDVYEPRTHISTGAWSTMGWCIPASIGCKLGRPEKQVVGICGDGDFLMTCQELTTAVQYQVPVVYCVLNNYGWMSIRDLQADLYGLKRSYGTTFMDFGSDRFYNPDFVKMAESFGARGIKVDDPHILGDAIKEAVKSEKPTVVEVSITNEHPKSGGTYLGFADFPVPWYVKDQGKRGGS
jgi:acetolactate synthase-1/2/3 large subunit